MQKWIDDSQYGADCPYELPSADYKVVTNLENGKTYRVYSEKGEFLLFVYAEMHEFLVLPIAFLIPLCYNHSKCI